MKAKLNLTIDEDLVPQSKEYARSKSISVSQLVEQLLRAVTQKQSPTFTSKWRGKFKVSKRTGPRFDKLQKRFLS